MKLVSFRAGVFLSALIFLSGCTTVAEMRDARNEQGGVDAFEAPYEVTYETAIDVLKFQGAEIIEKDKRGKYIIAKQGIAYADYGSYSYGEMLGLYFDTLSAERTQIKIVEKKRLKTVLFKNDWTVKFFIALRQQLKYKLKVAKV